MQESITLRRRLALERGSSAYSARRTAVLAAAADVFRHRGFSGTTMGSIASATGISRASLYYYLSGKQDLYREVVTGAVEANAREAERILATTLAPAMKLTEAIVALMRSFDTHYPFLQVYVQEAVPEASTRGDGWAAEMVGKGRRYEEALTAIVQEGVNQRVFHSDLPAKVVTYGIVGMLNWTCRWYRPGMHYSNHDIGIGFAQIVVKGLTTAGEPGSMSELPVTGFQNRLVKEASNGIR